MKQDFDELHYFSGYPDEDSMREKAKRLMLEEMMGTQMTMPGSITEPGREKMRLYKKGGHVKHHKHYADGGISGDEGMHAYEHEEIHPFHDQEARHHESTHVRGPGYRHGGKVSHKKHHHSHNGHHDHNGEHHSGHDKERRREHLHRLQREGLHETEKALKKESHLSRGGRIKDHHQALLFNRHPELHKAKKHHETLQRETYRNKYTPKNIEGGELTNLHIPTPKLNVESIKEAHMMHKGGHMHRQTHKKHHHPVKKAAGGTVYEREMRGERPTTHLTKINYEKDMKGMKPASVPHMTGTTRKNPGSVDQSFGSVFKKGGKACTGGRMKMAAGGVGKIRHGAADKFGRPTMKKRKMGY